MPSEWDEYYSGSPDIPRDKVSPKNKMPNILYLI
jgi:hypothetical protein